MGCGGCGTRTAVKVARNTKKSKLKSLANGVIVVRHSANKGVRKTVGVGNGVRMVRNNKGK